MSHDDKIELVRRLLKDAGLRIVKRHAGLVMLDPDGQETCVVEVRSSARNFIVQHGDETDGDVVHRYHFESRVDAIDFARTSVMHKDSSRPLTVLHRDGSPIAQFFPQFFPHARESMTRDETTRRLIEATTQGRFDDASLYALLLTEWDHSEVGQ